MLNKSHLRWYLKNPGWYRNWICARFVGICARFAGICARFAPHFLLALFVGNHTLISQLSLQPQHRQIFNWTLIMCKQGWPKRVKVVAWHRSSAGQPWDFLIRSCFRIWLKKQIKRLELRNVEKRLTINTFCFLGSQPNQLRNSMFQLFVELLHSFDPRVRNLKFTVVVHVKEAFV